MIWNKNDEFEKGQERTWKLPSSAQWRKYGKEPSELLVNIEEIIENPEDVQSEVTLWVKESEVSD